MLVLSRLPQEGIILRTSDGEIRIIVKSVSGPRVAIGIEAPGAVKVLRDEIYDLYHEPKSKRDER